MEVEFNAREKLPTLGLKNSPLLKQASKTYNPMIFKKFHDEYDNASTTVIKHRKDSQLVHEYIVGIFDESREYKVVYDMSIRSFHVVASSLKHLGFCVAIL